ncbi:ShlB/FhaC/HecB family hemolysin secretion/activation protein [Shigella sp. FC1967]|uniref:ShlB/FhaC/HecB family hemolysin secretion/activation protein n=1 Tax=Shigella sp. FC1967 TaxID=1898041 RepID=UPI00336A93AE
MERVAIDGIKATRGYKETKLNANSGFYWRNEINTPQIKCFLGNVNFIFALDYGVAHSDKYETKKNKIIGSAIGASFDHSIFSSQILINKPMFYPTSLKPDHWSFILVCFFCYLRFGGFILHEKDIFSKIAIN